jgi:polysaccharide export outer membrane protein
MTRIKGIHFAFAVLWIGLSACLHPQSVQLVGQDIRQAPPGKTFSQSGDYLIAGSDLIEVYVHNHPEYSGRYRVSRSGYITMHRAGLVRATGRSAPLLQAAITIKLRPFIKYPRVSVSIVKPESYQVVFSGSVRKPGVYKLDDKTTLLEGLAIAGGISRPQNQQIVIIRENAKGQKRRYLTNYQELMVGSVVLDNFILERGDIIYIN